MPPPEISLARYFPCEDQIFRAVVRWHDYRTFPASPAPHPSRQCRATFPRGGRLEAANGVVQRLPLEGKLSRTRVSVGETDEVERVAAGIAENFTPHPSGTSASTLAPLRAGQNRGVVFQRPLHLILVNHASALHERSDYQCITSEMMRMTNSSPTTIITGWISLILPRTSLRMIQASIPNMIPLAME